MNLEDYLTFDNNYKFYSFVLECCINLQNGEMKTKLNGKLKTTPTKHILVVLAEMISDGDEGPWILSLDRFDNTSSSKYTKVTTFVVIKYEPNGPHEGHLKFMNEKDF